jgi:hypothetical protein
MQQTAIWRYMVLGTGIVVPSASVGTLGREGAWKALHELFVQAWCHTTGMRPPAKYGPRFSATSQIQLERGSLRGH